MKHIEVTNSSRLQGSVRVQGSKNSSLALMAAACLSDGIVILDNIPDIADVHTFLDILRNIGAKAGFVDNNRIIIDPKDISAPYIDPSFTVKVRPAYYFIGSLLAKQKKLTIGYPGGDRIGQRPIDQHIKGLEAMGAGFEFFEEFYTVAAENLKGTEIYFDVITGGATLNLIMSAVLAEGRTTLHNAARDPEVVDIAMLLNKMGAQIHGAGTETIRIDGVKSLSGCTHTALPDRLIAGTYMMAAGITGGCVTVENVIPEHVLPLIYKLKEIGMEFTINDNSVTATSNDNLKPIKIIAEKFPMFETDFQQPASVLLLKAKGLSMVTDKIYPQRSNHCDELKKMGADIEWNNGTAIINGGKQLTGTEVHAGDIRAGVCLVLAGLIAEGKTIIKGVEHIERGFADIVSDLSLLGANIKLINNENYDEASKIAEDEVYLLKNVKIN